MQASGTEQAFGQWIGQAKQWLRRMRRNRLPTAGFGHARAKRHGTSVAMTMFAFAIAPLYMAGAHAEEWPAKPVRLVVPFASGGATDLLARAVALELGKQWKQPVVVDNRPGAGGAVGAEMVAKASPDGYTLLLASGSMFTVNPFIYQKLPYSAESFEMISKVASGPMVVTVNTQVPAKTMTELIAYAKANPGKLTFASAGNGSQVHMASEAFAEAAGIDVVHVPYKGEGPAYADLMAGTVNMTVGNINAISPLLKGGRLRALAVTGKERSTLLPDVPTAAEAGLQGFTFYGWFALMAPAGTPRALTAKMYADLEKAVSEPGMQRYLASQGMARTLTPKGRLPEEIAQEAGRWKLLVAKRKIAAN
ncbi:MFS transporter [Cupriavidus taiwanensis]|nr:MULTISPECIES: tripartite tricarboxylate transporter substrate binding protein [Cupriavidus]MCO4863768.1 tripartite tricarboxylate transporter substrate binding protein [Cupriavidus sp. WGlv3]MEC3767456.1 tripartite tricarboxylate transporter substrate binding protein [Cupriavidus sp. SS-3]SOY94573.1 MFS transporter [Cupriavidus taiwanensis]SOY98618.1 MFS transporter [Cupriavidus taiwanensis]